MLHFDASILESDAVWLANFLEETIEDGENYISGDVVTIGSMLFRVTDHGDSLSLQEPDMKSIPIVWAIGITNSIKLYRLQRDVTYSVGLLDEIDHPPLRSSLLIGSDVTQHDTKLLLERVGTHESDSGWFVGLQSTTLNYNDPTNLNRISVYQAILNWPQIAGVLGLPAGCRILTSKESTHFSRNGRKLAIVKDGLLDVMGLG